MNIKNRSSLTSLPLKHAESWLNDAFSAYPVVCKPPIRPIFLHMILKKQKHRAISQNGSVPYQLFRKQSAEKALLFRVFSRGLLISYNSFFHRFFQPKWKFSRAEHHKAHHQKCGQFLRYAGCSCYQRHAFLAYGVY